MAPRAVVPPAHRRRRVMAPAAGRHDSWPLCAAAGALAMLLTRPCPAAALNVSHLGGFPAPDAAFLSLALLDGAPALVISQFTGNPFAAGARAHSAMLYEHL